MSRPWMPLYVGDYLADTAHLRAAEHGAYLLLMMHYWSKKGLPSDDESLARIARMSASEWKKAQPIISQFFDSNWKHGRIEFELTESARVTEAGRKGGVASALARLKKIERPFNDRSTTVPTIDERSGNDFPTIGQALHPQKKNKPKKAYSMPIDWVLSETGLEFATSRGWPADYTRSEAERFRNYGLASGKKYRDFEAAWRNWVLSPYQKTPTNGYANGSRNPTMAAFDDLIARTEGGEVAGDPPMRDITPRGS